MACRAVYFLELPGNAGSLDIAELYHFNSKATKRWLKRFFLSVFHQSDVQVGGFSLAARLSSGTPGLFQTEGLDEAKGHSNGISCGFTVDRVVNEKEFL